MTDISDVAPLLIVVLPLVAAIVSSLAAGMRRRKAGGPAGAPVARAATVPSPADAAGGTAEPRADGEGQR